MQSIARISIASLAQLEPGAHDTRCLDRESIKSLACGILLYDSPENHPALTKKGVYFGPCYSSEEGRKMKKYLPNLVPSAPFIGAQSGPKQAYVLVATHPYQSPVD